MKEKSIVGDLINFRGLIYSPTHEDGVIFLFGKVIEDLNMYIEEIKPGFPDCIGRRFTRKGWEKVYIEFEYRSSDFKKHKHDHSRCDIIVCWEHDCDDCPIEVLELKEIIKSLPNKEIKRPDESESSNEKTIEGHIKNFPEKVRSLFYNLDKEIKNISDEIWFKVTGRPGVTYYSPERVFIYLRFQRQGLRLTIFTRGENIEGVEFFDYKTGGEKWGRLYIKDENQIDKSILVLKKSYELIKKAIKNNEPTGWYASAEEENEEEDLEDTKVNI